MYIVSFPVTSLLIQLKAIWKSILVTKSIERLAGASRWVRLVTYILTLESELYVDDTRPKIV